MKEHRNQAVFRATPARTSDPQKSHPAAASSFHGSAGSDPRRSVSLRKSPPARQTAAAMEISATGSGQSAPFVTVTQPPAMTVRTRFAPSPGFGASAASDGPLQRLGKRNGGKFILRIDDADQLRNREEALGPILNAFKWLGLPWDEGGIGGPHAPYYQSQRDRALSRDGRGGSSGPATRLQGFETAAQTKSGPGSGREGRGPT